MVSSTSHGSPAKLDFSNLPMMRDNFDGMAAYGQTKLCNVLMAKLLQQRFGERGLTACPLHPGTLVTTDIGRNARWVGALMKLVSPFTKNPIQGAATSVFTAVHEPASDLAGQYLKDRHGTPCSAEANNPSVAQKLWVRSEQWVSKAGDLPPWP